MSAGSLRQLPKVRETLRNCSRQITVHALLRGAASLILVSICFLLAASALDYLFTLPGVVRLVLLVIGLGGVAWIVWARLIQPLATHIPDSELGAAIDLSCPQLHESLATLISVERPEASASESGSPVMRARIEREVTARLSSVQTTQVVETRNTWRRCGMAGLLLIILLLPLTFWPSGSRILGQRLFMPLANLESATNLYFEVPKGSRIVARHSDVQFVAIPRWRTATEGTRPDVVVLQLRADDGNTETLPMGFDELSGGFIATMERIVGGFDYQVTGGGVSTKWFTLRVEDAPEIRTAVLHAVPPAYTGRAVQRFNGVAGTMEVFEQSDMEILLELNKPVTSAVMKWIRRDNPPEDDVAIMNREFLHATGEILNNQKEADPAPLVESRDAVLTPDGTAAVFHLKADVGGDFVFELTDEHGLSNSGEPERQLRVVYDAAPDLTVRGFRDGDRFLPQDIVPIDCLAVDDVGIGELEVHVAPTDQAARIIPAPNLARGSQRVEQAFRLDLSTLNLQPGQFVTIRIRTQDERPVPGPHEVWSKDLIVQVTDDAEAVGADAVRAEIQRIVEDLKAIEEQLRKDQETAALLSHDSQREWDHEARNQSLELSEKEQQQGRELEQIATDVAAHPLMQNQAEQLHQLGQGIRNDVPKLLEEAADAERIDAGKRLTEAEEQLAQTAGELHQVIQQIERIGELEQELAELNRLALEAEQLASDAKTLEQERQTPEDELPQDVDQQQRQQELDQRQRDLNQQRDQLDGDLSDLLRRQQELLLAARRAQQEHLEAIADHAEMAARQQQLVAEGVEEEAREAARESRPLVDRLEQAAATAKQLADDVQQKAGEVGRPDVEPLNDAVRELRNGNMAQPLQNVQQVEQTLETAAGKLRQPNPDTQTNGERQELAERSQALAQELNDISEELAAAREARSANGTSENPAATDPSLPAGQEPPADNEPRPNAARGIIERMQELAEASQEITTDLQRDDAADASSQQSAQQATQRGQQAVESAQAGKFGQAAEHLRRAAAEASQASRGLNSPQLQDRQQQLQGLSGQFSQIADVAQALQQNDAAQVATQQDTQQQVGQRATQIQQQLEDVTKRLNLPALGMQPQGRLAAEAQQAAQQAGQSAQQATSQLQQGSFAEATESGRETAAELNRVAQLAGEAAGRPDEDSQLVPSEVGESVTDALQNLQDAAASSQDPSAAADQQGQQGQQGANDDAAANGPQRNSEGAGQNGEAGSPGENGQQSQQTASQAQGEQPGGQPGAGQAGAGQQQGQPSGAQQLSEAAKALARAARESLPQQFTPGQLSEDQSGNSDSQQAQGSAQEWDGQTPAQTRDGINDRNWNRINDELNTNVLTGTTETGDTEYSALIRMYFRELARVSAENRNQAE